MRELRQYQKDFISNLSLAFKEGHRKIIGKLPTGAGKTQIASKIIMNLYKANKKALFICDRVELINQTSDRFFADGIDHGVIQADHPLTDYTKNIQVASVQTLARREIDYSVYSLIIIDEAHTLHETHINLLKNDKLIVLGLTATPFTKGLGKLFTKLIAGPTTKDLIELGFLVNPVVFAPSEPDLEKIKVVAGDYDINELDEEVKKPKLIGSIVEHWIKLAHNKPTICFAVSVDHSKCIVDEFKKMGIKAEHIDAFTNKEERKKILDMFKNGEIKIVSSVDILSKGFDYPGAEVAIMARPTKSLTLYIQQAGRVLRISPETGKKSCIILDHSGNTQSLGLVTDDTTNILCNGNKVKSVASTKLKAPSKVVRCPSCSIIKTSYVCENCGFEFLPKNKTVSAEGYLIEIQNDEESFINPFYDKRNAKDIIIEDREKLYGQLKQHAINKDWKQGRAYYLYKELTGEEPTKKVNYAPLEQPSEQLLSYLKYMQIKKVKSKFYRKN